MVNAGVEGLAGRPLQALSSGQQKRVMLARALAASGDGSQRVLLLDEPSNTLDLPAQREMRATLQRLAEQGTGVVLITHHVEDLVPAIGRVLLMRDGRIAGDGPTEQMVTRSGCPRCSARRSRWHAGRTATPHADGAGLYGRRRAVSLRRTRRW